MACDPRPERKHARDSRDYLLCAMPPQCLKHQPRSAAKWAPSLPPPTPPPPPSVSLSLCGNTKMGMGKHETSTGSEATKGEEMPEAVTNFLQRLVAHRQKFPGLASNKDADRLLTARVAGEDKKKMSALFLEDGSYLFPSERVMLNLQEGVDRAAEITEMQARYLIAQFLFGRILVLEVLLCSRSCFPFLPCSLSPVLPCSSLSTCPTHVHVTHTQHTHTHALSLCLSLCLSLSLPPSNSHTHALVLVREPAVEAYGVQPLPLPLFTRAKTAGWKTEGREILMASILFQILLAPWEHGLGPRSQPAQATQGSLRVVAFVLYTALAAGLSGNGGPSQVCLFVRGYAACSCTCSPHSHDGE